MAKYGASDLNGFKEFRKIVKPYLAEERMNYHDLLKDHLLISEMEHKKPFADCCPETAAQIFYHFDDRELGRLVVEYHSQSSDEKLRNLALAVKDLLDERTKSEQTLESVFAQSIPLGVPDYDTSFQENSFDNIEMAFED